MSSMFSTASLGRRQLSRLHKVVSFGFEQAATGLSTMVNKEIRVISPGLRVVPVAQVPTLIGEADEVVIAIYLSVSGDVAGHILLALPLAAADELITMLIGPRCNGTDALGEVERSALGEMANITGSFFLSAIGNASGLVMHPSPPAVMIDMIGAAVDVPLMSLALSMDDILVIDTQFIDNDRRIQGLFLMFPTLDSLRLIIERLDRID